MCVNDDDVFEKKYDTFLDAINVMLKPLNINVQEILNFEYTNNNLNVCQIYNILQLR